MLNPETTLDSWREWDTSPRSRPTVMRELGGGRSNRSYLLESGGERMVLRINAVAPTLPGIGRDIEAEIWRAASDVGIAPPLLHADPGGRFLVSAYIESNLPERPQDDPALAKMALGLLQRTHQLDINALAIDYAAHIEAYWQQIAARRLPVDPSLLKQRKPMRDLLGVLLASDSPRVLCHHDPVVENFVGTPKRMYLLDWEYAALGMAGMDYAALAAEWNVGAETLANQTGLPPGLLAVSKELYRYLCDLWETASAR